VLNLLLIVAWRHFCRDKLTSFIQLSGLVIGIACFILIQIYVEHQHSYNTQFAEAENIYRASLKRDDRRTQAPLP
jgi:putative ABC transport system permease protein